VTALPGARPVRAPRGTELSCRGWQQEAVLRMLMNNLDPEVAENPDALVVYGGTGRAARSWAAFDAIVRELRRLADDETLLVQSGKPVGVVRTHEWAPRALIANSNLVGKWATWDVFRELEKAGLMMYGQMTAGSWIYIGTQGILQGTYETFAELARRHFGGSLKGRVVLTAGLGGIVRQPVDVADLLATGGPNRIHLDRDADAFVHRDRKGLGATHPTEPGGEHDAAFEGSAEVLPGQLGEGLVRALENALGPDVDPGARGHLAVHHQAGLLELPKDVPGRPLADEVRVCDEDPRRPFVRSQHADGLA
jgi:hypothetical protein